MFGVHKAKQEVGAGAAEPPTLPLVSAPLVEGFTQHEVARLLETRHKYQAGRLNEHTLDYNRLAFARWLYQHGHMSKD